MLLPSRQNTISAILATLGALALSSLMALAKQLHPGIPTALVIFMKSSFGLIFLIPFLISNRKSFVKTKKLPWHILRVTLAASTMLCTYYAYRNLPIAFATSVGMSGPLFTTLLSAILLKENISPLKWLIIILGYIGVIIIIKPTTFLLDFGTASALLANLLAACTIIVVKILSRYDSTLTIMIYSNIGITLLSFVFNINGWQALSLKDLMLLSFIGILSLITQFCSVTALKYSTPSFVAPFEYMRIPFAILIGLIIFDEIPAISTIIGSVIIIFSAYMLSCLSNKNSSNN